MRINGFEQIKAFYSIVFEQKFDIKPQHVSLYVFLINQNNRNNWVEWFKCPFDLAMAGACIGNKKTYYNCLNDLQEWKLITYEKGLNEWKSPKIRIEVLKCTSTVTAIVPQSTPLPTTLPIPQGTPLPTQSIDNLKPITINKETINKICKFFNISEMNFPRVYFSICEFVECLDGRQRLEHFKKQFEAYSLLKNENGFKHSIENFLGSPKEFYEDGKWVTENWETKAEPQKPPANYMKIATAEEREADIKKHAKWLRPDRQQPTNN